MTKPSLNEVHPELQEFAKTMPLLPASTTALGLIQFLVKVLLRTARMPAGINVHNRVIYTQESKETIRLRIYNNETAGPNAPALLWMHGGGYLIGTPEQDDAYVLPFVQAGIIVISVDYRLAPKHPFPTPLNDCHAALQWMTTHAATLGIDPQRIAIGGNSAGAGLAAALAQLATDQNAIRPAFQLLVYPMLDDRTSTRTDTAPNAHIGWNNQLNHLGWQSYLAQAPGGDNMPTYAVPARRTTHAGLPPAWIGVGTLDLFHDEDVAYAQQLQDAGVPCELVVVQGAFHGFDARPTDVPVVKKFREAQIQALKNALF